MMTMSTTTPADPLSTIDPLKGAMPAGPGGQATVPMGAPMGPPGGQAAMHALQYQNMMLQQQLQANQMHMMTMPQPGMPPRGMMAPAPGGLQHNMANMTAPRTVIP